MQRFYLGAHGNAQLAQNAHGIRAFDGGGQQVRLAEEARDIAYRKMDGSDVLMFPLGKEVGPHERLESLTVELKWKDIPFERFRL